jgi:uncharacterized membrane protein
MAGIGFELKKLLHKESVFQSFRGVAYASMSTIGPMILIVFMLLGIQIFMLQQNVSYADRELLSAAILYAFVFSLVFTSFFTTIISRYIADKIYEEKTEEIYPSVFAITALLTLFIGIIVAIFYFVIGDMEFWFSLARYLLLLVMVQVFTLMTYVTAIKEYARITWAFVIGFLIFIVITLLLYFILNISLVLSILYAMILGFGTTSAILLHAIRKFFYSKSKSYFEFLGYYKKYSKLALAGGIYILGLYSHNFIMWFSDIGSLVADVHYLSYSYDMATFLAVMVNIPALVIFVVRVETSFYSGYHKYCAAVEGASYEVIQDAKREVIRKILSGLSYIAEIQLFITLILVGVGFVILPLFGFAGIIMDMFPVLAIGFYLAIMVNFFIIILYYYEDYTGALFISIVFLLSVICCTYISVYFGRSFYGLGIAGGGLIGIIFSYFKLKKLLKEMDYRLFCSPYLLKNFGISRTSLKGQEVNKVEEVNKTRKEIA